MSSNMIDVTLVSNIPGRIFLTQGLFEFDDPNINNYFASLKYINCIDIDTISQ